MVSTSNGQSPFSPDRMQSCHADYAIKGTLPLTQTTCQSIRIKVFPVHWKPRHDHYPLAMDPTKSPKLGQEIEFLNEEGLTLQRYPEGQLFSPSQKIQKVAIRNENGQLWIKTWSPRGEDLQENTPLKFEPFWVLPTLPSEPTMVFWKGPNKRGVPIDVDMTFRGAFAVRTLLPVGPGERSKGAATPQLTVINQLPLEEYLYATVASEIRSDFHVETFKAQAVGARTFGLRAIMTARYDRVLARPTVPRNPDEWDVLPTTMFQQYLGVGKENSKSIDGVNATKGQYLAAQDVLWKVRAPIEAMYSDTSGGFTCFPADCMGGSLVRPSHLSPVMDAPGTDQPEYFGRTTIKVSPQRVQAILAQMKLKDLGRIVALSEVPQTRRSQRVQQIRIETENNTYLNLSASDSLRLASALGFRTRLLLSQAQIRSEALWRLAFEDALTPVQTFVYGGLGHPIGMSQWGAAIFAQTMGYSYAQILTHYYTGAKILRLNQRF